MTENGPTPRQSGPELLDETVIAEIENLDGVALTNLLTLYFDEAARHMSELGAAIGRCEALTVGQRAHKLKGGSGTIGAAHVAHIASELEATAKAGDLTVADELLDRLHIGLDDTRDAFRSRVAAST